MIIHLCDQHTLADVITAWGGMEPHVEKTTKARLHKGVGCDACGSPATHNTRVEYKEKA